MRRWIAILASVLALPFLCTAAARADECDVPHYMLLGDAPLQRLSAAVAKNKQIEIAVLGTTSSTLPGADGATNAYPARLEAALKKLLPALKVTGSC